MPRRSDPWGEISSASDPAQKPHDLVTFTGRSSRTRLGTDDKVLSLFFGSNGAGDNHGPRHLAARGGNAGSPCGIAGRHAMKIDVLGAVANQGEPEARDVAEALGMSVEGAAMALLRAYRAGLLTRSGAGGNAGFRYAMTQKGWERLEYLNGGRRPTRQSKVMSINPNQGDDDMRSKKLHSGLYHCPECLYEVTLTSEASLRCEDCKGRLYEGGLPDEEPYEEEN